MSDPQQPRPASKPLTHLGALGVIFGAAGLVACSKAGETPLDAVFDPSHDAPAPHADAAADAGQHDATGTDASVLGPSDGWLYTSGNKIYVNRPGGGVPWMGRGVNMDDIFLCGFNYGLQLPSPETQLETIAAGLIAQWKPNFIRISLGMNSHPIVTSWLGNPEQYKTPMTNVIRAIGAHPNVYVLVTLRSDASMIGYDQSTSDREATGLPSGPTTTPDPVAFPTGTDATYVALVDTFADDKFVMFGLTNEPGGDDLTGAQVAGAMQHAVEVIRAEEDRLGVRHHIISVQGNNWTKDVSYYASSPIPHDNIVYEVHGYPPTPNMYTYSEIPVILGEYGTLNSVTSLLLYSDLESKQISNLAWDFEPYSDCTPDLVVVSQDATILTPSTWGSLVKNYLTSHAP